jgi:hypothetical protein
MKTHVRPSAAGTALAALATAALLTACTGGNGGDRSTGAASAPASSGTVPSASAPAQPVSAHSGTAAPSASATAQAGGAGCRSLVATAAVKQAVTTAYGHQAQPPLVHIQPEKGSFFYGECGGTYYAATPFQPGPGATLAEQVALQDDGAAMKYLSAGSAGTWRYVASDGLPADPRGCAAIPRIPAQLAALWNDCAVAH